ncbi:hypothetical protein BGX34_001859 [Mortierella sp. NVP85]|nr:hypothetical protein BGX34_001859 [Mortierella sp. NVP85]
MLSALQLSSIPSTSDSDTAESTSQTTTPNSAFQDTNSPSDHLQAPHIYGNEPDMARETLLSQNEDHDMDYVDTLNTPDIIMTDESAKIALMGSEDEIQSSPTADRSIQEGNRDENGDQYQTSELASHLERPPSPLVVDTSNAMIPASRPSAAIGTSPLTKSTPTTAALTLDSASVAPSSKRSSLRTMTVTLPRSPLQEETIALFKQYRALIPCAKCFSRNTIQRDGMSDGNLRFKCRPPVSMSLICNKSYSESKIRGMIANAVYGHALPYSGTSSSATLGDRSSENGLTMATTKSSRRPSQKIEEPILSVEGLRLRDGDREYSVEEDHPASYEEMNINGGHPHPVNDRRTPSGGEGSWDTALGE